MRRGARVPSRRGRRDRRLDGQVTAREKPAFGRSYQTPYADAIRNQVDVATIAVGVISSYDDVNTILLSGRADLCAPGRVHLCDPNWTLHAAIEAGLRRARRGLAAGLACGQAQTPDRPR